MFRASLAFAACTSMDSILCWLWNLQRHLCSCTDIVFQFNVWLWIDWILYAFHFWSSCSSLLFLDVFVHFPIIIAVLTEWTIKAKPLFLHKKQHWRLLFSMCLDSCAKQQYLLVQLLLQLEMWLGSWTNSVLFLLLMRLSLYIITGLIFLGGET